MIKHSGTIILFLLLFSTVKVINAQDAVNTIDKVVWVIGEEAILKSEVEEERLGMLARGERIPGDPYCIIPEELAIRKLYLDQAKIDSIDIPQAQLNKEVQRREKMLIANVGGGSREKLEEYWSMPIAQIRERLFQEIQTSEIVSEVQQSLTKNVTLTPSEVRKYYNQLPKDSLPYIETSVEVQILTSEPTVPLTEIDIVKGKLRDYTNRIYSGETDFATLAMIYSEDGSATNGGELGFNTRVNWDPAFANMAFSLSDPKKVSNVFETEYGYHIVQLIERRGDRANVRHILLKPKVPYTEIEKASVKLAQIADSIQKGIFSFEEAVFFLSFDKDTRNNDGLMVNQKMRMDGYPIATSRFLMEELPPAIAKVVDTMKIGEISAPVVYKNPTNQKDVVALVKLKSRIKGHTANVSDDYEDLRQIVEMKKKEELLTKWVQRKISETYVYIDPDWRNCTFKYQGWLDDTNVKGIQYSH